MYTVNCVICVDRRGLILKWVVVRDGEFFFLTYLRIKNENDNFTHKSWGGMSSFT